MEHRVAREAYVRSKLSIIIEDRGGQSTTNINCAGPRLPGHYLLQKVPI